MGRQAGHEFSSDWFTIDANGHDLSLPGVYEWRIQDVGIYVGKAKVLCKRIAHYPNNVRRKLLGLPWHGDRTRSYRGVHEALADACVAKKSISVVVLETCLAEERLERERFWIDLRASQAIAGGPPLLNAQRRRKQLRPAPNPPASSRSLP